MGRIRTSVTKLETKRSFRKDRQPKEVGDPLTIIPEPPATLSTLAKQEWNRLAPAAIEIGTLTKTDLRAFEMLCEILATEQDSLKTIAREGIMIDSGINSKKTHPAVNILEAARAHSIRLFDSFGLTPKGRQQIDVKKEEKINPFSKNGSGK